MSDNPILEPVDKLYPEPTKPTDVTADQKPSEENKPTEEKEQPVKVSEATVEDKESIQYLELDGKEYELDEIRVWKNGHMMQKDYTKKTTEHARQKEKDDAELKSGREALVQSQTQVIGMRDQLTVLVAEDEEIDWKELKDNDPDTYIKLKEKADSRKEALDKIKAQRATPYNDPAFIQSEQGKLFAANPEWLDDDKKATETHQKDITLIAQYATKAGFSPEEFERMTYAHHMITLLKAAKYDELQEKGRKIKATRDKVPVITKPKAAKQVSQPKDAVSIMYPDTG